MNPNHPKLIKAPAAHPNLWATMSINDKTNELAVIADKAIIKVDNKPQALGLLKTQNINQKIKDKNPAIINPKQIQSMTTFAVDNATVTAAKVPPEASASIALTAVASSIQNVIRMNMLVAIKNTMLIQFQIQHKSQIGGGGVVQFLFSMRGGHG